MEKLDYAQKIAQPSSASSMELSLLPEPMPLGKVDKTQGENHEIGYCFTRFLSQHWSLLLLLDDLYIAGDVSGFFVSVGYLHARQCHCACWPAFGTALTSWQIHHYKTAIPIAVNAIAIAAGALPAFGFIVRENFASSAIAFFSFGTAGALIAYVVFAAIMISKSQQSYFR